MRLSDFDYKLSKELIAQYPSDRRDASRLLVLDRNTDEIKHKTFSDIVDYLKKGDVLVLNETQVLPARLIGKKNTGGKVDCLILEKKSAREYSVLLKPFDIRPGAEINFDDGSLKATLIEKGILRFNTTDADYIYSKGLMPLPPYIKRIPEVQDISRYQTVFARNPGAVAAPTAGLHFTRGLLSEIKKKGVKLIFLTLHINYATFNPVKVEDVRKHKMHKEYYQISKDDFYFLRQAKESGNRIGCVGTTSARVLETLANLTIAAEKETINYEGYTDLYIYPGYRFKMVDLLLTNFHLPRTTLLILVSAFAGKDRILKAYSEAIKQRYRFYSYGDAMLIT